MEDSSRFPVLRRPASVESTAGTVTLQTPGHDEIRFTVEAAIETADRLLRAAGIAAAERLNGCLDEDGRTAIRP